MLVAIVNDLAACGPLNGSAFNLDGTDRLAVLAYGKSEDCRRVSLGRELAADDRDTRGRDTLVGLGEDTDVQTPRLRDGLAALVVAVVIGAIATGLDIAGYSLNNGVADVDVAASDVWLVVSGRDCNREFAFRERVHDGTILDDDVVPVSDEGDGLAAARACADRHGRVIERNALVGIDTIFNTACVKGGVRDRETALSVDGKISLGVRLDLATARDVNAAVSPNRRFFYRACFYLATAFDDQVTARGDAVTFASFSDHRARGIDGGLALGLDTFGTARCIHGARARDREVALCLNSVGSSARGVHSAWARNGEVACGFNCIGLGCHIELIRAIRARYVQLRFLVSAILRFDGGSGVIGLGFHGVLALVRNVELACSIDRTAVIAVELHIVGAVPGPGAGGVSRGPRGRFVADAADVHPLGRERDARHEQRAHRERAYGAYNDAACHAAPAAVCEQRATAHVGLDKMGSRGFVIALGGREQGGHGYSHPHRAYAIKPSISAGCSRR